VLLFQKSQQTFQFLGWRTLVSGHGFGGNTLDASSYLDRLRKIVQLLPYYIPPVVIANLINMAFFCVLLCAVEILPFINNLMSKHSKAAASLNNHGHFINTKFDSKNNYYASHFKKQYSKESTPNTFLDIILRQSSKSPSSPFMMDSHIPLPPTYIPPEAAIQDLDATFLYVIAGMTILAMAFGNLIIWNFVSTNTNCTY